MTKKLVAKPVFGFGRENINGYSLKLLIESFTDLAKEWGEDSYISIFEDEEGYADAGLSVIALETDAQYERRLNYEKTVEQRAEDYRREQWEKLNKEFGQ